MTLPTTPTRYCDSAPLDDGRIEVELVEHVLHLRQLQHLRDARLDLFDTGWVDDLAFLRDAPPVITWLRMNIECPVDLALLADCSALEVLAVVGGGVSMGVEVLSRLTALYSLSLIPPDGGRDVSFLGDCPALTSVSLYNCTELADLSALTSVSGLRDVNLGNAMRLRDLRAFTEFTELTALGIYNAPLSGGLDAVTPVLGRLERLGVGRYQQPRRWRRWPEARCSSSN